MSDLTPGGDVPLPLYWEDHGIQILLDNWGPGERFGADELWHKMADAGITGKRSPLQVGFVLNRAARSGLIKMTTLSKLDEEGKTVRVWLRTPIEGKEKDGE